jgi:hypothetical protein
MLAWRLAAIEVGFLVDSKVQRLPLTEVWSVLSTTRED